MQIAQVLATAMWHADKACDLLRWSNFEKNNTKLSEMYADMRRHFHISDVLTAHSRRMLRAEWIAAHKKAA